MHDHEERLSLREIECLGEEIAEVSSHIDAAVHRLLSLIRHFDAAEGFATQGALTCAHLLSWRIGVGPVAARDYVRVARALGGLPLVDEALRRGEISYCKVRALTRVATSENEATLLEWARSATGAQLEALCAKYRRVLRVEGLIPVDQPELRFVRRRDTSSGMVQVTAQLLPEEAAVFMKALDAARERAPERTDDSAEASVDKRRSNADRVDALLWMAEAVLNGRLSDGPHPSPVEVVVHVGAGDLSQENPEASLDDGRRLEPETTERLLCDSAVVTVTEDEGGTPLDVGRRTRTIPSALKRALRVRDGGCRFPGCTNRRTDGHHVVPWSKGGATALSNLVSLCRRHHRFVHELGWTIDVCDGNEILFRSPGGWLAPRADLRSRIDDDAIAALREELAAEGIDIDASTSMPRWEWRAPDFGLAVEGLLARRAEARPFLGGGDSAEA